MHWHQLRSQISQVFQVTSHIVGLFALHFVSPIQLLSLYQIYHLRGNDCRCDSLINSKTIYVSKKNQKYFLQNLLIPKTINPHEITDVTDIADFTETRAGSWLTAVHISKHSPVGCRLSAYPRIHLSLDEDTLKITVGCLTSAYPSIHADTQDHGRLPAVHISKHSPFFWYWNSHDHGRLPDKHISKHSQQKLAHLLDSLVHTGNTRAVGTSTRADACACAGVLQPRLFEFTSL